MPPFQPAMRTNFATAVLPAGPPRIFTHQNHGTLTINRQPKGPASNAITFQALLTPVQGAPIHEQFSIYAVNADDDVWVGAISSHRVPGGNRSKSAASVGYGDIDLRNMSGRRIIYVLHHVMALAGQELGVPMFVIATVVNPQLATVCQSCGMTPGSHPGDWQGTVGQVMQFSRAKAVQSGWH